MSLDKKDWPLPPHYWKDFGTKDHLAAPNLEKISKVDRFIHPFG